jgi:hypothetical protein
MTEQPISDLMATARRFAAARIPMPEDRLEIFAASVARNHEAVRAIVSRDYGSIEPASTFRAPPQ